MRNLFVVALMGFFVAAGVGFSHVLLQLGNAIDLHMQEAEAAAPTA